MADTLSAKTTIEFAATYSQPMDSGVSKWTPTVTSQRSWADGTGTGAAQDVFCVSRTIAAAAFENLDLTALVQDDAAAATVRTVVFVQIKAILIRNTTAAGTGGYLTVGGGTNCGGAADAWVGTAGQGWLKDDTDLLYIPNDSEICMTFSPGVTVTNTDADVLGLGATTQNQTYTIMILGDTA